MRLILRRLFASSTFAIAGTLRSLIRRLEQMEKEIRPLDEDDFEAIKELEDEWSEGDGDELSRPLFTVRWTLA